MSAVTGIPRPNGYFYFVVSLARAKLQLVLKRYCWEPWRDAPISKENMPELTITAIARRARVSLSTLRYYEKIGI
jgi:hypothetical protein